MCVLSELSASLKHKLQPEKIIYTNYWFRNKFPDNIHVRYIKDVEILFR